ncbi:MAG: hypothetical protein UT63_C0056G0014 [Candidatus Gottesmanbacteria bacterium GW2011_GWC2_39_8]|uniref:DedA family protein n=1 Tax=Candidatus Gottesmanbacteria bacterium GW2011_GWC2_39_8 TaxID=1618450 RepID=A0A0G0SB34_9BACT|nr:MAG: hypothetical protein UT63_C0056G0014 [Candidatus Gottesmanbacteria bacterium GW2011_GWC2_39_8]
MILFYLFIFFVVYLINVIPAFMPGTWMVLAYFKIKYNSPIYILAIIGAIAATLGRVTLSLLSRDFFRPFFSKKMQENMDHLGKMIDRIKGWTIPLMFTYAFFPVPSNQVFIALGLARVRIRLVAISFFLGRLVSYSFWVFTANYVADNLEGVFTWELTRGQKIIGEIFSFILLFLFLRIDWLALVKERKLKLI